NCAVGSAMPRKIAAPALIVLAALLLVSLVAGVFARTRSATRAPAAAKSAPATAVPTRPTAGGYVFRAPAAMPVATVVRRFWAATSFMTKSELEAALRAENHLERAGTVKAGQEITIPGYEAQPLT